MKTSLALAFILLTCSWAAADEAEFVKKEAGFAIRFPKQPTEQTQTVKSDLGDIKVTLFIVELTPQSGYFVAYNKYPDKVKEAPAAKVLAGVVTGTIGNGKIEKDSEIKYKDTTIPGREVTYVKDGSKIRARFFLSGARLYQILVIGADEIAKTKETDAFFDSFRIDADAGK